MADENKRERRTTSAMYISQHTFMMSEKIENYSEVEKLETNLSNAQEGKRILHSVSLNEF